MWVLRVERGCCGTRPKRKWPRIGGAIKRGAALCQFLVSCDHYGGVKLLGEIISAFSPQNSSSTEKGVWTRRESNPHLHFDREPCYRCTTGPDRSLCDGGADSKSAISNFFARVPNWDENLRWCRTLLAIQLSARSNSCHASGWN